MNTKKKASARKAGKVPTKKAAATPHSAGPRKGVMSKSELEEWERIRNSALEGCLLEEDARALERKISDSALCLRFADGWEDSFKKDSSDKSTNDPDTARLSIRRHARQSAAMAVSSALRRILNNAMRGVLNVIEHGTGEHSANATRDLVSLLVETINSLLSVAGDQTKRGVFINLARTSIEFPSLLSAFNKQNLDFEKFVMKDLGLGAELPFAIDPRRPATTYTWLAMRIVEQINYERRHLWANSHWPEDISVYRKVVPDLDKKDFVRRHASDWQKVIAFHLDFFQAPRKRQERIAFEFGLEEEWKKRDAYHRSLVSEVRDPEGNLIQWSRPGWMLQLGTSALITEIPEFQRLLKSGSDSNVKKASDLYGRVKHKVIDAALGLMKP